MTLEVYLRSGPVFLATTLLLPARSRGLGVVFSHGWGGTHAFDDLLRALAGWGVTVASIQQRGYGRSTGKPALAAWPRDMAAAGEWLRQRGLHPWVMGVSTGGTMALVAAGRYPWLAGAIALSPFATLRLMERTYPPARKDLTARFGRLRPVDYATADAVTWGAKIAPRPALVLHARHDPTTPLAHAERLRDEAGLPLHVLPGRDHWFETADRTALLARIRATLARGPATRRRPPAGPGAKVRRP